MDPVQRQRLSEILIELRGDRSQRKYAKDLGVSFPALRSWEECESVPGLENLEMIASAKGWSLIQLLGYIRGEEPAAARSIPLRAEDLLREAEHLEPAEQLRLAQLLIGKQLHHFERKR